MTQPFISGYPNNLLNAWPQANVGGNTAMNPAMALPELGMPSLPSGMDLGTGFDSGFNTAPDNSMVFPDYSYQVGMSSGYSGLDYNPSASDNGLSTYNAIPNLGKAIAGVDSTGAFPTELSVSSETQNFLGQLSKTMSPLKGALNGLSMKDFAAQTLASEKAWKASKGAGQMGGSSKSGKTSKSSGSSSGNTSVDKAVDKAVAILKKQGIPANKLNKADIKKIIQKESGGNAKAVNNWDSNAKKGTPSKGLMQTIEPTFNAHKLPGHDDIFNPVDNIIAGVRYAISRYGSVSNVPGIVGLKNGSGYRGY